MEKPEFDPEATMPPVSPEETQPPVPAEQAGHESAERDLDAMLDRVRQQDEELKAGVAEALRGAFGMDVKVVGDFEEVGENRFRFTVDFGGEAREIIVERPAA